MAARLFAPLWILGPAPSAPKVPRLALRGALSRGEQHLGLSGAVLQLGPGRRRGEGDGQNRGGGKRGYVT